MDVMNVFQRLIVKVVLINMNYLIIDVMKKVVLKISVLIPWDISRIVMK